MSTLARTLFVVLSTVALVLGIAGSASAHVTVTSSSTAPGSGAVLTFTVPVESDTAGTVGLTVHLPTATPFTSVRAAPVPGWDVALTRTTLPAPVRDDDGNTITSAVTAVSWTATAGGLGPGQFGQFLLSVGPLPASGTVYLPAVQRYADGSQVNWVQQAQGGAEPDNPAPSVTVTPVVAPAAAAEPDGWGIGLAVTGIVLALLAGALGGVALTRARNRPAPTPVDSGADLTRAPS